jgi:hypothetical protein
MGRRRLTEREKIVAKIERLDKQLAALDPIVAEKVVEPVKVE